MPPAAARRAPGTGGCRAQPRVAMALHPSAHTSAPVSGCRTARAACPSYPSRSSCHKSSRNSLDSAQERCATRRAASTSIWPAWTPLAAVSTAPGVTTDCRPHVRSLCLHRSFTHSPNANSPNNRRHRMRSQAGSAPGHVRTVPRLARRRADAPCARGGGGALQGCVRRVGTVCRARAT